MERQAAIEWVATDAEITGNEIVIDGRRQRQGAQDKLQRLQPAHFTVQRGHAGHQLFPTLLRRRLLDRNERAALAGEFVGGDQQQAVDIHARHGHCLFDFVHTVARAGRQAFDDALLRTLNGSQLVLQVADAPGQVATRRLQSIALADRRGQSRLGILDLA